jgi:hypothetical protein
MPDIGTLVVGLAAVPLLTEISTVSGADVEGWWKGCTQMKKRCILSVALLSFMWYCSNETVRADICEAQPDLCIFVNISAGAGTKLQNATALLQSAGATAVIQCLRWAKLLILGIASLTLGHYQKLRRFYCLVLALITAALTAGYDQLYFFASWDWDWETDYSTLYSFIGPWPIGLLIIVLAHGLIRMVAGERQVRDIRMLDCI